MTKHGKVLHLTSNFPRFEGDSTTPFVLHLAEDLQALGWDIDVLAPHDAGIRKKEIINNVDVTRFQYWWPQGGQTVCYKGGALTNLSKSPLNYLKLPALIAAELWAALHQAKMVGYDIIHSHWILPQGFVGSITKTITGIPHVVTIHGSDVTGLGGRMLGAIKRKSLASADAVTVNSSYTEKITRQKLDYTQLYRIPMGASVPLPVGDEQRQAIRNQYCRPDELLLCFAGRLVEEKGVVDILHAVKILKDRGVACKALIIGEGQDKNAFVSCAQELGLGAEAVFTGWMSHDVMLPHLASSDVFVGPSKRSADGREEAQGLAFIEAMLCRVSVVATRSGGIPDSVVDGETGWLVDESAPEQIASTIENIMAMSSVEKQRVIKNAYQHALQNFTRPASAERFSNLYKTLLAQ